MPVVIGLGQHDATDPVNMHSKFRVLKVVLQRFEYRFCGKESF